MKTISQPRGQTGYGKKKKRTDAMSIIFEEERNEDCGVGGGGTVKQREKGRIEYSIFKKGARCKRSGLLG